MKSDDTKRIIKEIAKEEGLSEEAVRTIILSQFKGVTEVMRSATPDKPETFKGIRLNALCHFKVRTEFFKYLPGHDKYLAMRERNRKLR